MILKDELKACLRLKRNLSQQLSEIEGNMWAIIDEYKEKLNLAATHEQRLEDEYTKMSREREVRERAINSFAFVCYINHFTDHSNYFFLFCIGNCLCNCGYDW